MQPAAPRVHRVRRASAAAAALVLFVLSSSDVWARSDGEPLLDFPSRPLAALDFTARTLTGDRVKLSELRGTAIFLNFWATWCVPCREEMPAMERVHLALKGKPFRMLAVNMQERPEIVRKFVDELGLTFEIVLDPAGEIAANYLVRNLPLTYFIDQQGTIVARAIGARPWDQAMYMDYVRALAGD